MLLRVLSKTKITSNGCWEFQGFVHPLGYGIVRWFNDRGSKSHQSVHRLVYKMWTGEELARWDYICHKCDNRKCHNPDHLYRGTAKTNMEDCTSRGRHPQLRKTHCKSGHELNKENTYTDKKNHRYCRVCNRTRERNRRAKLKQTYF